MHSTTPEIRSSKGDENLVGCEMIDISEPSGNHIDPI